MAKENIMALPPYTLNHCKRSDNTNAKNYTENCKSEPVWASFCRFHHFFYFYHQAIALMAGFCFFGSAELTQRGIQSVQGAVFIMITENTFGPMYSVLAIFPQGFPLFLREKRSGLYNTVLYYVANVIALVSVPPCNACN